MTKDIDYEEISLCLIGEIDEEYSKALIQFIIDINKYDDKKERKEKDFKREPIEIYMTTPGGYVDQTLAMYDVIKSSKTPVYFYISGECCSGGFILIGAATKVFAYKNTQLMYHQLSTRIPYSKYQDIKENLDMLKHNEKLLEELVLKDTKITKERLKEVNEKKQDWWMDTEEALKLGVIDEIIGG